VTMPRLALTTTRDRSLQLIDDVAALGMEPMVLPCIELIPATDEVIETARTESAQSDWLLLTSPRTVHRLWPEGGMPATNVAAVGQATAEAVSNAGGTISLVGDGGARELAERITRVVAGQSVFFPHAAGADRSTIDLLEGAGAEVRSQVVYESSPVPPDDDAVDAVVFGSSSAVTGWFLSRELDGIAVGVIGKTTAAALAAYGYEFHVIAMNPSFGELIRLMAGHLREGSTV
jgi:uroporphyrinogen-III synthase